MEEVPRLAAALPFLFAAVLLVVAQVVNWYVGGRFEEFVAGASTDPALLHHLPAELRAGPLRQRFQWSADIVQAAVAVIAPIAGVAMLKVQAVDANFPIVLVLVVAVTLVLTFVILGMAPGTYERMTLPRGRAFGFSLVTLVGICLNCAAAVAAYLLAQTTYVMPSG